MNIVYYNKETKEVIDGRWALFVMNNEVYRDNFNSYESQSSVITFENFIEKCPDIGWRVE